MNGETFDNRGQWAIYQDRHALYQSLGPFQLTDDGYLVEREQAHGRWVWQEGGVLVLSGPDERVFFVGTRGERPGRYVDSRNGLILDNYQAQAPVLGMMIPSFPRNNAEILAKVQAREDFTVIIEPSRPVVCAPLEIDRPPTFNAEVDALFGPVTYRSEPLYYQVLHDAVIVSGVGVIDRGGRALYDTIYQAGLRTRYDPFPLLVAEGAGDSGLCLYGGDVGSRHRIPGTVLLLNTLRGNYGHWMVQSAPAAALGRHAEALGISEGRPLTVLDHSGHRESFRAEAMAALGYADGQVLDMAALPWTLWVERLIVPSTHRIPDHDNFPPGLLPLIDQCYPPLPPVGDEPEFIFINRNDLPRRGVANGAEVEAMLAKYGFVSLNMAGRSFTEQRRIFSRAKVVISTHSGGMTNLLFAHHPIVVIELGHEWHRTVWYKNLCLMRGHKYVHLCFDKEPGDDPNPYQWQVLVDVPALERVVQEVMPLATGPTA